MRKILLAILCVLPLSARAQGLEQLIELAQDSTLRAFQSRYEYEYAQQHFAQFLALRKPQLEFRLVPNYQRIIADPTRDYVYIRNFDRLSTVAQLQLTQKVLGLGGEAYVGSQAIWSEYFARDQRGLPREFVALPVKMGYQQPLMGYNPFRWEKAVEDGRLESARKQLSYDLHRIAEETTVRYFLLVCAQGMLDMCERNKQTADTLYAIAREKASIAMITLAELRSLELQRFNAANALQSARNEEQVARESLLSYLRTDASVLPARLPVPGGTRPIPLSDEDALELARANSPALLQQQVAVTQARQQQDKVRREGGVKVGLDLNMGLQQLSGSFPGAFKDPTLYMSGAVTLSVPLMDHGAAKKGYAAASAWEAREEMVLREQERALTEDVLTTLENLSSHEQMLSQTAEAVALADDVFELTAENYANGLCDINTYSLAQSRRDEAYNQHLKSLAKYWTTYYHFLTLTQYE
jgi:outer membrane protein TolC